MLSLVLGAFLQEQGHPTEGSGGCWSADSNDRRVRDYEHLEVLRFQKQAIFDSLVLHLAPRRKLCSLLVPRKRSDS